MTRIASFDVGIRTFNFCIVNHCVVNHKFITERIHKAIDRLKQSVCDLQYELNELCRTLHLMNSYKTDGTFKTVEIEQWTLDDLFPIEQYVCIVCNKSAKWKSTRKGGGTQGYCTRHKPVSSSATVVEIKKRNITTVPIAEICKATVLKLREYPELLQCDRVIIEKQAGKFSARIGRVESYLYSYFMDHGVCNVESKIKSVSIVHAKGKLKVETEVDVRSTTNKKGSAYRNRKSASVQIVINRLEREYDYNRLDYLNSVGAKKDDLCDNYLQALYVLGY